MEHKHDWFLVRTNETVISFPAGRGTEVQARGEVRVYECADCGAQEEEDIPPPAWAIEQARARAQDLLDDYLRREALP